MNKEEKEAIEQLKKVTYNNDYYTIDLHTVFGFTTWNRCFEIILNLTEKQRKTIDRLKKDKDILYGVIDEKNNDIRVKINELKGLHLDNGDTFDSMRNYAVLILEELLEEN